MDAPGRARATSPERAPSLARLAGFALAALAWSRSGEDPVRQLGALWPVLAGVAVAWPRHAPGLRRAVAGVATVGFLACGVAALFARPAEARTLAVAGSLALGSALACAALGGRAGRAALALLSLPVAAALGLLLPHLGTDGRLEADAARAVAQTNVREAIDYLLRGLRWDGRALAAAAGWTWAVSAAFSEVADRFGSQSRWRRSRWVAAAAGFALAGPAVGEVAMSSRPARFADDLASVVGAYQRELALFDRLRRARLDGPPRVGRLGPLADGPRTVVVVIGESTARRHWSLYGYPRPTSAPLSGWAEQLLLYSDVVSPHSHTIPVLEQVLAGIDLARMDERRLERAADLVSIARAAGWEVTWLSTQAEFGVWDNFVRLVADGAHHRAFLDSRVGTAPARQARDEELVPALEEALERRATPRRLVFVHMMGGHSPYCTMFNPGWVSLPPLGEAEARAIFGPALPDLQAVGCYDRAIEYGSAVLARLLEVSRRGGADTVLFFPDHGESPETGTGHESQQHVAAHVEIPLAWWLEDRFWARHSPAAAALRAHRDAPVSSGDLYHTLQDLLGAAGPAFSPERSLIRPEFEPVPRTILGGRIEYDRFGPAGDAQERVRGNVRALQRRDPAAYRRVWAHRVDTLAKLQEAAEVFAGVELDVVVAGRELRVYHPPAPDIGLTLEAYLRTASRWPELQLWLDVKDPGSDPASLGEALGRLDSSYGLRRRAVVELPPVEGVDAFAAALARAGWTVSRYLPTDELVAAAAAPSSAGARVLLARERERLRGGAYAGVSYDARGRAAVDALLEGPGLANLGRRTWDLAWDPAGPDFLRRPPPPDAVVLVPLRSRFEN